MNYLGVDFGTSNCVACASGANGEITFVPLEGESILLPTVLFVNRAVTGTVEVDEDELEKRVQEALAQERRRRVLDEKEINEILIEFDNRNKPNAPVPPQKPDEKQFPNQPELYKEELAKLEVKENQYSINRQLYLEAEKKYIQDRRSYEVEQNRLMRAVPSEEALRKSLRVVIQRENSEEINRKYQEQTFFDALTANKEFLFGLQAINAYAEDPLGGFYLRSPKSFLGADIGKDHQIFFINIITKIISHIKEKAENFFNKQFDGIILGRPVNYHGSRGELGNQQALSLMRQAAKNAQFKEIKFFIEPVAATLTIKDDSKHAENTLIVDIGGGTTDCSFLKFDNKTKKYHVIQSTGSRIGGTDFDETLAWNVFMPYFGKGTLDLNDRPIPSAIIRDSIATRDLQAQLRFTKSGYELTKLLKTAAEPQKLRRLLFIQENQYQHKLIIEAERLKIGLSNQRIFRNNLSFIEKDLEIQTEAEEYADRLKTPIASVLKVVDEVIAKVGERPELIYLTGGMSRSKQLIAELQKNELFLAPISHLDSLSAVGHGLGLIAQGMTENPTSVARYLELGLQS